MNKRIHKKLNNRAPRWAYSPRKFQNFTRKSDPYYLTLRVLRRADLKHPHGDVMDPKILVQEWEKIARSIERSCRREYKRYDWAQDVQHGLDLAEKIWVREQSSDVSFIESVTQTLYYDLMYYSDRWCLWRYVRTNALMGKLKELLCQTSSMS